MNSPGIAYEVLQQVRERLARRLLHRQHLDDAVDRPAGGRDGTRRPSPRRSSRDACRSVRRGRVDDCRVVVHELPEEAERLAPSASRVEADVAELHLEAPAPCGAACRWRGPGLPRGACSVCVGRQPAREARRAGLATDRRKSRAAPCDMRRLVEQDEVQRQVVTARRDGRSGTPRGAGSPRARRAAGTAAATNGATCA